MPSTVMLLLSTLQFGLDAPGLDQLPTQFARLVEMGAFSSEVVKNAGERDFRIVGSQHRSIFTNFEDALGSWGIDFRQRESKQGAQPARRLPITLGLAGLDNQHHISRLYEFAECSLNLGHGYHISPVLRVTYKRDEEDRCEVDVLARCLHYGCYMPVMTAESQVDSQVSCPGPDVLTLTDNAPLKSHFESLIPIQFRRFYQALGQWSKWSKTRMSSRRMLHLLYEADGMNEEYLNNLSEIWSCALRESGETFMTFYRSLGYWCTFKSWSLAQDGHDKMNHYAELMRRECIARAILTSPSTQVFLSENEV